MNFFVLVFLGLFAIVRGQPISTTEIVESTSTEVPVSTTVSEIQETNWTAPVPDNRMALTLAQLSAIAYSTNITQVLPERFSVKYTDREGAFVVTETMKDGRVNAILVYQGTQMNDFEDICEGVENASGDIKYLYDSQNNTVASIVTGYAKNILQPQLDALNTACNYVDVECNKYITGHSKGGAEAMLAATTICLQDPKCFTRNSSERIIQTKVYTFGAPIAIINVQDTLLYSTIGMTSFRYELEGDCIPDLWDGAGGVANLQWLTKPDVGILEDIWSGIKDILGVVVQTIVAPVAFFESIPVCGAVANINLPLQPNTCWNTHPMSNYIDAVAALTNSSTDISVTSDIITATTEVVPTTTEIIPTTTEVVPTTTEVVPTTTEIIPEPTLEPITQFTKSPSVVQDKHNDIKVFFQDGLEYDTNLFPDKADVNVAEKCAQKCLSYDWCISFDVTRTNGACNISKTTINSILGGVSKSDLNSDYYEKN